MRHRDPNMNWTVGKKKKKNIAKLKQGVEKREKNLRKNEHMFGMLCKIYLIEF